MVTLVQFLNSNPVYGLGLGLFVGESSSIPRSLSPVNSVNPINPINPKSPKPFKPYSHLHKCHLPFHIPFLAQLILQYTPTKAFVGTKLTGTAVILIWGFPKIRGTFAGVPIIIRIIVF